MWIISSLEMSASCELYFPERIFPLKCIVYFIGKFQQLVFIFSSWIFERNFVISGHISCCYLLSYKVEHMNTFH